MRSVIKSILAFLLLGLIASGAEERIKPSQIVGSWRFDDGRGFACVLRFIDGGTFSGHQGLKQQPQMDFAGTWSCAQNRIFYTYKVPAGGRQDVDQILEIADDHFVIRNQGGEVHRYERIPEA